MKTDPPNKEHFVDVLGMALHYAVLTKKGRIQILIRPTEKELRKRGKRGWQLFGTVEGHDNGEPTLIKVVQQALHGMEGTSDEAGGKKKKSKRTKTPKT